MNNTRRQKRLSKRFPVHFGVIETEHMGFAKNVSLGGMELSSKTIYHPGTLLNLELQLNKSPVRAKGAVRWVTKADKLARMSGISLSMGVELTVRPDGFVDSVLNLAETYTDQRSEPRFGKVFKVVFDSPAELLDQYTQDISMGGIFVISDNPPAIDTAVRLELIIAENLQVIRAAGVVVHVINYEMVQRYGLNPGFGVQFTEFFEDGERLLRSYVNDLKARMGEEIDPREQI